MYKPRWLPCKTNNENVTAKGKKHLTSRSCWKGWELGRVEKRVWKASSMVWLWRQRRMSVNEMDREDAKRFSQVKDSRLLHRDARLKKYKTAELAAVLSALYNSGIHNAQWSTSKAGAQNNHLLTFHLALLPGKIMDSYCELVIPLYNSNGGKILFFTRE